jgi:hypothetical protein
MSPTWTIALLTVKEAVRRRLLLACVAITGVIVGLSAWGFDRVSHTHSITSGESHLAVPDALILFMFMTTSNQHRSSPSTWPTRETRSTPRKRPTGRTCCGWPAGH